MMQRFKGRHRKRRIDITKGYLVNPSHDFTYTLVNEKMKMLIEKFGLKTEPKKERVLICQDIRELYIFL